jgi:hypothetical protein
MPKQKHVPTVENRRMIRMMVAGGIIYDDIAAALGISRSSLKTHYKTELKAGGILANHYVIANMFRHASGQHPKGNPNSEVAAGKWWTQARLGWSEKHEFSGPGGTPLNPPGQTYVVRMPTPVESVKQWMDAYVPDTEREPSQ